MDILFLNLPYESKISRASRWPEKTKSGTLYYPYWLAYCVGACENEELDCKLVDCITRDHTIEDTIEEIRNADPDYIMCELTTPTASYDYMTLEKIKENFPSIKIIVGGTHATALPEKVIMECKAIDFIVRREYDFTVPRLVKTDDPESVEGISYRKDSSIVHNPDCEPTDLNSLPFVSKVYQKYLNMNDYGYAFAQKPMIQIVASRGCPNRCSFCSYPSTMGGRNYRIRDIGNLADEFEYITKMMPEIREIFIEDDTFTVDERRTVEFCDELIKRNINAVWSCNTRVDISYKTMEKMKEAGCRLLVCGYESGNQHVLDANHKGITLKQSREFAKNARKLKIRVFGCFIIGLKGDNPDTIRQTYEFAREVYPDMCFFQQAVPFPGTEFYEWARKNNYLITEDYSMWLSEDGYLNCLLDYPYATHEEIEKIRDSFMRKYYFSFGFIARTFLSNLDLVEFRRVMGGAVSYIAFQIKNRKTGK